MLQLCLLVQPEPKLEIGKEKLIDFSYVKIMETWKKLPDLN